MNPALILTLLSGLGKGAKALYGSKNFLNLLIGGGLLGGEALRLYGGAKERGLQAEELDIQGRVQKAQIEAAKLASKESRKNTEKYIKEMTKIQREKQKREDEAALLQSFMASQDRQAAIAMQAIQGLTQAQQGMGTNPAGMVGLMRSRF